MKYKIEEEKGLKEFTIRCLLNEEIKAYEGSVEIILEYWKQADSLGQFKKMVLEDERLKLNQGYAELSKETPGHTRRIKEIFGDKCFTTISDVGSVKVMNEHFAVLFSNNRGDGDTKCAIFSKKDQFNKDMMNLSDIFIEGEMYIADHDCGNEAIAKLSGKYFVYTYNGYVAFVEC